MYTKPTFNLMCDVYSSGQYPGGVKRATVACQLRCCKTPAFGVGGVKAGNMFLAADKGTDLRPLGSMPGNDTVVVPTGSTYAYAVVALCPVGRGFTNEYLGAILSPLTGFWTIPFV